MAAATPPDSDVQLECVVAAGTLGDTAVEGWPPPMAAVPSDAELSAAVGDILAVENLESLTVRTMMGILAGRFHGVDLTPRKRFIKDEVDRLMHMHTPVQPDDVAHAEGGGGYDQQHQQHLEPAYPPAEVPATCTF